MWFNYCKAGKSIKMTDLLSSSCWLYLVFGNKCIVLMWFEFYIFISLSFCPFRSLVRYNQCCTECRHCGCVRALTAVPMTPGSMVLQSVCMFGPVRRQFEVIGGVKIDPCVSTPDGWSMSARGTQGWEKYGWGCMENTCMCDAGACFRKRRVMCWRAVAMVMYAPWLTY